MVNPKKVTTNLFYISIAFIFFGIVAKTLQLQWSDQIFIAGGIFYIIFVFYCLNEIWSYKNIKVNEKGMWLIFLFMVPIISGIIYLFSQRKRIV